MTFYHMCKSSTVFDTDRRWHGELRENTWEEMEERLQRELENISLTTADFLDDDGDKKGAVNETTSAAAQLKDDQTSPDVEIVTKAT